MLGVLAKRYGLRLPEDVQLVYLGADAPAYVGAFQTKLIDAAMPFEPAGIMLEQKKLGGILINLMSGDLEEFRDMVFMGVATSEDIARSRPDFVRKVVEVFSEAQAILLDPARGKKIMAAEFPEMEPETNERSYETLDPDLEQGWAHVACRRQEGLRLPAAARRQDDRFREDVLERIPAGRKVALK